MTYDIGNLALLPIRSNDDFSRRLANHFGLSDPDKLVINRVWSNGEYCPIITDILDKDSEPRLEGRTACIVYSYTQSHLSNTEAFARILLLSDAAYRNGAADVVLIMAESLFDRQDLDPSIKFKPEFSDVSDKIKKKTIAMQGQPFTLETAVKHFKLAGISKVLTLDRHSDESERVYRSVYSRDSNEVLFNLDPVPIFVNYALQLPIDLSNNGQNLVLLAPDKNAWKSVDRFKKLSGLYNTSIVYCDKNREVPNDPTRLKASIIKTSDNFRGVKDKIVVAIDDKADTMGTLRTTLVEDLTTDGKPRQLHAFITHMIMSTRSAYENIYTHRINLHGSNSHPNMTFKKDEPGVGNITVIDFTPYFAWALVNHVLPGKPIPEVTLDNLMNFRKQYGIIKQGHIVDYSQ